MLDITAAAAAVAVGKQGRGPWSHPVTGRQHARHILKFALEDKYAEASLTTTVSTSDLSTL